MYESAVEILQKGFVKPINEVHARHLLSTFRQRFGETLDEYLEKLTTLARNCDHKEVTAEVHMNLHIRDAFVSGIRSMYIRQRLLEDGAKDLQGTVTLVSSLEAAHHNLRTYSADLANPSRSPPDLATLQACAARQPAHIGGPQCYFCGQGQHSCQRCPARSAICNECGKKGHFAKVCLAGPKGQKQKSHRAQKSNSRDHRPRNMAAQRPETPTSDASSASCESWGRPSWRRPSSKPKTCDRRRQPFCESNSTEDSDCPQLGAMTLDQSRPKHLRNSMMQIREHGEFYPSRHGSPPLGSRFHVD
ncbi:uncharacterized protein [Scyliorhinus torazame]|uniref:uncharacterized protein n=1 Tax=Scyliorhinus torazame TaxID=75743 RepID=UPI003B59D3EB